MGGPLFLFYLLFLPIVALPNVADSKHGLIANALKIALDSYSLEAVERKEFLDGGLVYFQQTSVVPASGPGATAPPSGPSAPAPPSGVITLDQFQRIYEYARVAAESKLGELSVKAIKEALKGGPPAQGKQGERRGYSYTQTTINGVSYYVRQDRGDLQTKPDAALATLVPLWRNIGVSAKEIYDVLVLAVLPDARPAEVFLSSSNSSEGRYYTVSNTGRLIPATVDPIDPAMAKDLAQLLIRAAVEAKQIDDLTKRTETRLAQPLGELPAMLLLFNLALDSYDDAKAQSRLAVLGQRLKKDSLALTRYQIAAAATRALERPALQPAARAILSDVADAYSTANNMAESISILSQLVDSHQAKNDTAGAKKLLDRWRDQANKTHSNDPAIRNRLGGLYLKTGFAEEALAELAYALDFRSSSATDPTDSFRPDPVGDSVPLVVKALLEMPAAKRYKVLKTWTLPTSGRKSLRYFVGAVPKIVPPAAFVKLPPWPKVSTVGTMLLLIDAAREAGKADDLLAAADQVAKDKIEGAAVFRLLAYLSLGKGKAIEADGKTYLENLHKRLTEKLSESVIMARRQRGEESHATYNQTDVWVAQLAAKESTLKPLVEKLATPMVEQAHIVRIAISDVIALKEQMVLDQLAVPGAIQNDLPAGWTNLQPDTAWFVQDGLLGTETRDQLGQLMFGAPLSGTFEFSVDYLSLRNLPAEMQAAALIGGGSDSATMQFAGLSFSPNLNSINSVLGGSVEPVRGTGLRLAEHFNRLTVKVSPKKLEVQVNGKTWYEDADPAPTSPWIYLTSDGSLPGRRPVFRNFQLTGKPEVPDQVKLIAADFLEGWNSLYTNSNLPNRIGLRFQAELRKKGVDRWGNRIGDQSLEDPDQNKPVYDWIAKDAQLQGRKQDGAAELGVKPSHISYRRPLQDGEKISCEFFYQAGAIEVHPTLGRLAFLLEPEGIQWYWIRSGDEGWLGLSDRKGIAPPAAYNKAQTKLPLKNNDWNALSFSLAGGSLKIELNGTVVHEGPVPAGLDRDFGFFHWLDRTSAKVRNIVLKGNWPKAAPDGSFQSKPVPAAIALARRALIGEGHFNDAAGLLLAAGHAKPVPERLNMLSDWVLPNANRTTFQLGGILVQRNILGHDHGKEPLTGKRIMLPSLFESPALEMVALAKEVKQLEPLQKKVLAAPTATADAKQAQIALLSLIAAALGNETEAKKHLAELKNAATALPLSASGPARLPMLLAVYGVLEKPSLATDAFQLVEALNLNVEKAVKDNVMFDERDWWFRNVRFARARLAANLNRDAISREFGDNAFFKHWSAASGIGAESRNAVASVPHWRVKDKTLVHEPGFNDFDYLILNTPLRGDFTVSAKLRLQGWQEATVRYGGVELRLDADRKSFRLARQVSEEGTKIMISPPLKDQKALTYDFKMEAAGGNLKFFIDGQQVHQENIGPLADPWLAIRSSVYNTGLVEGLTISGAPTVPQSLELTRGGDFPMWRNYYPQQGLPLQKRGEEMHSAGGPGNRDLRDQYGNRSDGDGDERFPEMAHYYQRPMVEDGVVEYDFYYSPGKAVAHPMIDRLAFLLEPEGVKLHTLTDGPWEKSGISPTNAVVEPSNRRGPQKLPLKEKAWNRVKLTVAGDKVLVALNGTDIYEKAIEPTNQRFFGIFHFKDKTEARVRSMTYTGQWPKKLPATESLFEVRK